MCVYKRQSKRERENNKIGVCLSVSFEVTYGEKSIRHSSGLAKEIFLICQMLIKKYLGVYYK